MNNKNCSDIIDEWLIENSYTGLTDGDGCNCGIGEKCGNCLLCKPTK